MATDIFKRMKQSRPRRTTVDRPGSGEGLMLRGRGASRSRVRIQEAELLAEVDRIPSLPAVVTQILNLVSSSDASAGDMEGLIQQDMVIAGRLLKLVNSPFYGLPNQVASLTQAVAIIGFGSMRSLVLAASASKLLDVSLTAYGFQGSGLWTNALVTASLAQDIAKRSGSSRELADECLVAGLMRDVGMLVIGPFLEREGVRLTRSPTHGDILDREQEAIGFDHCWAGDHIAQKWSLPDNLRLVVSKHHRIPSDATESELRMLACVRLAERLAYRAGVGLTAEHPFETTVDAQLLGACGLDGEALKELIARVPDIIKQAADHGL